VRRYQAHCRVDHGVANDLLESGAMPEVRANRPELRETSFKSRQPSGSSEVCELDAVFILPRTNTTSLIPMQVDRAALQAAIGIHLGAGVVALS